jgi:AAA domain
MSAQPFKFQRPELADGYCEALQGTGILDAQSGLFLAAPRRTGKSTFLREDLLPALKHRGWTTVYADLWANKASDPAILIANEVKNTLAKFAGVIAKLAKSAGLGKVNVFGALSLNLSSLSLPESVTLADAIEALVVAANTPVVVIIDEAQHALSTPTGMDAMFALKAARDRLNQGTGAQRLFLVFTGSSQDKLSRLVLKKDQPFYGCRITKFPLLDKRFSDNFIYFVNAKLAPDNQFDKEDVFEAFKLVGHRPEMLRNIIADLALDGGAETLAGHLKAGAAAFRERIWGAMESEFAALTPIQRAVLERIIQQGTDYSPFTEASLKAYMALAGAEVTVADAQGALNALRQKNLVWQAAYGDYALEDESMLLWYQNRPAVNAL